MNTALTSYIADISEHVAAPPLALAWEQPWLLMWGAAATLPLLIHLLSRRRYQTTPWAAMEFLLAAARKQSRRVRLENWLLLILRTLIILLFVIVVAGPYEEASQTVAPEEQRVHTIFVLDGSFSMGQGSGGKTLFQTAKDTVVRSLESERRRDDAFSLVLMAAPARAVVKTPSTDRRELADVTAALELPHGRADLAGTLSLLREMVAAAPRAWPPLVRQEIVFLTDLGRNTWGWNEASAGSGDSSIAAQFAELAKTADVRVVELGSRGAANVAITQLALGDNLALAGADTAVSATLRNFTDAPRANVSVELLLDGRRIEQRTIASLPARGESAAAFSYRFNQGGSQALETRVANANDALEIDNRRALAVSVRDRFRTLCVSGGPNSADFVAVAAAPRRDAGATFEAQVISPALLRSGLNLDDFDVVALCNVPPLGNEELRLLADFVRRGGGLVWFLGDMADVAAYQSMLSGELAGLLPAAIVQQSSWSAYTIDPLEFAHPILDPFRGQQDTTLARTPVQKYVRLTAQPASGSQVVLRVAETGDPLVVEGRFGLGRVVAFATDGSLASVDPATKEPWTYWPVWQSFLPVVQETLRFAAAGADERHNVLVGMPLSGPLKSASQDVHVQVRPPNDDSAPIAATIVDDAGVRRWSFADTALSGVYQVEDVPGSASAGDVIQYAVNVDTAESDLSRANADGFPEGLLTTVETLDVPAADDVVTTGRSYWHVPLLCGLLALVALEFGCAWLLGRRMA